MAIRDEKRIIVNPNGVAELQVDRVKEVMGAEPKRMKLARHTFNSSVLSAGQDHLAVLPSGCVFVHEGMSDRRVYVIEQPPCVRPVVWNKIQPEVINRLRRRGCVGKFGLNPDKFHNDKIFRLAFPYVVFIVNTAGDQIESTAVHFYFRTEPLRSWNDDLYLPSVPNFNSINHNICWGSGSHSFGQEGGTLARQIDEMVHAFWNTPFNDHWLETYDRYAGLIPELSTPWHWQYYSLRNPLFVLDADWIAPGRTPKSFIQNLQRHRGEDLFEVLVNAAQRAPRYIAGMDDQQLIVSPSPDIFFQGVLISVLDTFVASGDAAPFKKGETYQVKHFFEPKKDPQTRMVQLVEMAEPIRLDLLLAFTNKAIDENAEKKFMFNGIEARVGNYIEFTSAAEFPPNLGFRSGTVPIEDVRIDMDGDLEVCFRNNWFYITVDQGKTLRTGYSVKTFEVKDGAFSFDNKRICEGESVYVNYRIDRVHDVFFDTGEAQAGRDHLVETTLFVAKVFAVEKPFGTTIYVRFRGMDRDIPFFCNGTFFADWKTVQVVCKEKEVRFGEDHLKLLNSFDLLAKEERRIDGHVHLYTPVRFVNRTTETDRFEQIDLEVAFGNAPIPVVKDGKWVWNDDYTFVQTRVGNDTTFLKTGSVLRVDEAIDGAEIGSLLQVVCFDPTKKEIFFSDGRFILFSEEFLFRVSVKQTDGSFKKFPKADASALSFTRGKTTETGGMFVSGEECLYVGNDSGFRNQVMIVKEFRPCGNHFHINLELKDGRRFGEVGLGEIQKIQTLRLLPKWPSTVQTGNYTDGKKTFQISEKMLERQLELKTRKLVGEGVDGKPISIGDVVTVTTRSWGYESNGGISKEASDTFLPALVVHSEMAGDGRIPFLFLWFEKKVCTYRSRDIIGYEKLPEWVRKAFTELGEIGANRVDHCLALTMVPELVRPVEKKEIIEKPVRIKTDVEPVHGRGNVLADERGFIVECANGEVIVCFPNDPEWMGKETEIEIDLQVGDKVRMKEGVKTPIFLGTFTQGQQIGIVCEDHANMFRIDFPEQPGWYASIDEIEYVP